MLQRRYLLSSATLFLGFALSCALHAETERSVSLGEDFRLSYGEEVPVEDTNFSLHFIEVLEDSRCPVEVQCFWQGNAQVQINVQVEGETVEKLLLNTAGRDDMELSSSASWGDFTIELTELLPAKSQSGPEPGEYAAGLKVSQAVTEEE